jgi:Fe-S cluster biogenesis protein NfuA
MTETTLPAPTFAERVETALRETVRPALSAHAGTIRVVSVSGAEAQARSHQGTEQQGIEQQGIEEPRPTVHLELLGSCSACYFRRACVTGVVRPALEERVGSARYVVDNARI